MTDPVREAARRMYDAFNRHDHEAARDVLTPDFRSHALGTTGPASVTEAWRRLHDAYPEARVEVEDMVVEGDTVAARLRVHGVPGQDPMMLEMYRVRDGRVSELWALSSLRRD